MDECEPVASGASRVDFDAFLMALHQKDNMMMRACTQAGAYTRPLLSST